MFAKAFETPASPGKTSPAFSSFGKSENYAKSPEPSFGFGNLSPVRKISDGHIERSEYSTVSSFEDNSEQTNHLRGSLNGVMQSSRVVTSQSVENRSFSSRSSQQHLGTYNLD